VTGPTAPGPPSGSADWAVSSDNQVAAGMSQSTGPTLQSPSSQSASSQLLSSASSCMPLHRMVLSKPVYPAASTPEIRGPVETTVHEPALESVTCPTLHNPLL